MYRSSFSQHNVFAKCKLWWYFLKVKQIPVVADMENADAGNVVHKTLQAYYTNKMPIEEIKVIFNRFWDSYKINRLRLQKDEYWNMVLNGINENVDATSTELKIFFDDCLAFLDIVHTGKHIIADWKTSKRGEENDAEYKQQGLLYAWLYHRKFGVLPQKVVFHYLRYIGEKSQLVILPTIEDITKSEEWYKRILSEMEDIVNSGQKPIGCKDEGVDCHIFCPYGNECFNVIKFILHLTGNNIMVEGEVSELLNRGLEKKFSYELKNSYWIKKNYPQANTTVMLWKKNKQLLPIGFLEALKKTLSDYATHINKNLELEIIDERILNSEQIIMPEKFINGTELREYQEQAVNVFLDKKIGLLEIGTGGGKTELAIELMRRLKYKTLFIIDKRELLRQTKRRIEECLGIKVGQIGEGEQVIEHVTVATIQTLIKRRKELADYLSSIRFVVWDECHKVPAKTYGKISAYLNNTEYRLGLSATAFRDDGNDMLIEAITGPHIYDLSSKILIENGWLMKPQIMFYSGFMDERLIEEFENKSKEGLINETDKYLPFYKNFIMGNWRRNELIVKLAQENEKVLILVKLVEHGKLLEQLIPNSRYLYGETITEDRKDIMEKFASGEIKVLISTISIFSEGIDLPALSTVINAAANRGNVKTIQILGRILRRLEGKTNAKYIDFIDESRFFKNASYARRRILRNEGHDVEVINVIQ